MESILLIDDDVELCSMLSHYRGRHHYQVSTAHNGTTGLAKALAGGYSMVLRVDRSGHPGQQVTAGTDGNTPVWAADNCDGSYTVALFNLNASTTSAAVTWSQLGFSGSARVYDLWNQPLGEISDSFSVTLPAHGSSLIRVSTKGRW